MTKAAFQDHIFNVQHRAYNDLEKEAKVEAIACVPNSLLALEKEVIALKETLHKKEMEMTEKYVEMFPSQDHTYFSTSTVPTMRMLSAIRRTKAYEDKREVIANKFRELQRKVSRTSSPKALIALAKSLDEDLSIDLPPPGSGVDIQYLKPIFMNQKALPEASEAEHEQFN